MQAGQHAHPETEVELWAMDEHRIGLKPVLRRGWVFPGQQPQALVQPRYQWLYLYGLVQPETGQTEWWLMPTVNTTAFGLVLAAFAKAVGAGPTKQVLVVVDQAGWHVSQPLVSPPGIHLHFLPPYSPELQPSERLWPLTNEVRANRSFHDLDELEAVQAQRCLVLQQMPDVVRAHTSFHWWPRLLQEHEVINRN